MRRPLIGNGIPLNIPGSASPVAVKVFDTSALDPNTVYAVTVFAWWWSSPAKPVLSIGVTSSGDPVEIAQYPGAFFTALESAPEIIAPYKVVDQFMMRGDQQMFVLNSAASGYCYIYGYFEAVGESAGSSPYRGLLPSNTLLSPYNLAPAKNAASNPVADSYVAMHQLSAQYIDYLTLKVHVAIPIESGSPVMGIRFPGSVVLPLFTTNTGKLQVPMTGIPVRGPNTTPGVTNLIDFGLLAGSYAAAAVAYGAFHRIG